MSQGPRPDNRSRSRWLAMTGVPVCAGLFALSLAPVAVGQASPPVSAPFAAVAEGHVSAVAASPASTAGGLVSPASALTFTNRTTADGLGSDYVTAVYVTDDTIYAGTAGGLSASTDGGATFTNDDSTAGLGSDTVLAVHATDDTVYVGTLGGLSISTDGGASFNTRNTSNSGLADDWVYGVYAVGSKVYAATMGGLSISIDGGMNFTTRLVPPNRRVWNVFAIDDTVYAGTDNQGLRISTDGGVTFPVDRRIADGLAADNVRSVYAAGSTVYTAGTADFFTSGTGGVSISTNGGATFTYDDSRSGLGTDEAYSVYESGGVIYAGTRGGVSVSSDGGATYTNYSATNSGIGGNEVLGVFARGGVVYAATDNGLSISGSSLPVLNASPATASIVSGATGMVTISSTAQAIPDDSVVTAVSSAPGVATVTSSVNASGGTATFTITGMSAGSSSVTFSAPGYANAIVPVTVTAPHPGPGPEPGPVFPPSAPASVNGFAGDGTAVLSWTAPVSSGSFPISSYQAVVSPGGQSCLVSSPELTCTITGLTNGTAYTATVRVLNGAGWGPYSAVSATFTPQPPVTPSITITGTRAEVRGKPGVVVTGTTTSFGIETILRPWIRFPGQTSYTQGAASILVDMQGGFTWERRTGKTVYITIRSEGNEVVSNRLIVRTP